MSNRGWLQQAVERGLIAHTVSVNADTLSALGSDSESEAQFQARVIDLAHALGWRVAHFRRVRVQRQNGKTYWETPVAADGKGFLDLELVRERIVKVELKVGANKPTPEQLEWLAAYKAAGVECHVWYPKDWPEIVAVLQESRPCNTLIAHGPSPKSPPSGG